MARPDDHAGRFAWRKLAWAEFVTYVFVGGKFKLFTFRRRCISRNAFPIFVSSDFLRSPSVRGPLDGCAAVGL